MSLKKPILLSWSGGKDSALALHALRSSPDFEPAGLLTTINEDYDRVSVHGVRRELLERQAESIGLPLREVLIPKDCPNEIYEDRLAAALREAKAQGIHHVAFGDLFLEDIRAYREKQMAALGLTPIFPVWGLDTGQLARDFIGLGFRALLVCVDTEALDSSFVGRAFDESLLRDLPPGVDPCGENGEFHTFVHAGPVFREPVGSNWDGWRGGGGFGFGMWIRRRCIIVPGDDDDLFPDETEAPRTDGPALGRGAAEASSVRGEPSVTPQGHSRQRPPTILRDDRA